MYTLSSILRQPMSAEEYLLSQRERFRERYTAIERDLRASCQTEEKRAEYIRRAERFMQNMYQLPGTGGKEIFVGDPPAWSERIVPDEEYLWGLNRLPEQNALTSAYLVTGDIRYAEKAIGNIMNWIETCACPDYGTDDRETLRLRFNNTVDISPWRILEAGIRMFESWRNSYVRLLFSEVMTPQIHEKMVCSMHEHGCVLSHVSPKIWPNADHNHFFHEMLGLLCVSMDHPEWKDAAAWQKQATHELLRCCQAQITPEGGQLEGCPGYHSGCLSMMFSFVSILRQADAKIPPLLMDCIRRASEYSVWTLKPTGLMASFGDTTITPGGIPAQANTYRSLFADYGVFDRIRPLLSSAASEQTYEGGIMHFRTLGQITARTGWTRDDSYFMFGCNTPVPNGHSHQDPMSFVLTLNGRDVVTDPSHCTYMNGEKRKLYKSPEYHSTLTFGGRPPFTYISTWSFGEQKEGKTVATYAADGLLAGDAFHRNYEPSEHRRLCALIGKDVFLTADDVYNASSETVRLYFHMDTPDWTLTENGATDGQIRVHLPAGTEWSLADSTKAPRNDTEVPTKRIIVTDENPSENAVYITLFTSAQDISDICAQRAEDGIQISYKRGGECIRLLWKFGEKCELLK